MGEFKNLTPSEIADRLCEIENPVIFIHTRADGDCIGSAAALSLPKVLTVRQRRFLKF